MGLQMPIFFEMSEEIQFLPPSTFIISFSSIEGSSGLFPYVSTVYFP